MRILLVEDDVSTREVLESKLRAQGCHVDGCADAQALATVAGVVYSLIFLNIMPPVIDGMQLCTQIRSAPNGRDSYILVFTANHDSAVVESSLAAGADDYLLKPVNFDTFGPRMIMLEAQARNRAAQRAARIAGEAQQSEFIRIQESLRNVEDRYRLVSRIAKEAIWDWNLSTGEVWINDAFDKVFSYAPVRRETAAALEWWKSRLQPQYFHQVPPPLPFRAADAVERSYEYEFLLSDQSYAHVIEHRLTLLDSAGKPVRLIGIFSDVARAKQSEEALRQTEQQLRQSQKMEAIGQLAGGVAHDFNNLLTVINGRTQLMLNRLPSNDAMRRELDLIYKTGERAAALTRQLLAFSRTQVLEPKILDLNVLVTDMDKMLRRLIREDIDIKTLLDPGLSRVKADPAQIEQVVMNLALNAKDAMPGHGILTIETSNVEVVESATQIFGVIKPGHYVLLSVADTGTGMSSDVKARIFEPFFTTKERGKGTGLGLSTVYGIVKQSGGHVEVSSELGSGTTFRVYLPRTVEDAPQASSSGMVAAVLQGQEVVLVVEDEPQVRELVRDILEMYGYKVLVAQHGAEALVESEKHKGKIDLLMTDVVMPEMGGPEIAERLLKIHTDMKVIFMSGYTDHLVVQNGTLKPGVHFLQKPFPPSSLARKVRDVLDNMD